MLRIFINIGMLLCFFCASCFSTSNQIGDEEISLCTNAVELSSSGDLDQLITQCEGSKLVLLGESTHGTAEFYHWRGEISKRLIAEKGFNFIVVEGDWASIYKLNLYVKGISEEFDTAREILETFNRWPEWMWGNMEVERLAEWLKDFNTERPLEDRAGFYGMDVYGQWEAMGQVVRLVEKFIPHALEEVKERFGCFTAYDYDEWQYAQAVAQGYPACNEQLEWVVELIKGQVESVECPKDRKKLLHAKQSALVVKNSEDFYRLAVRDNVASWNSRASHMHNTTQHLLKIHGDNSRGIVWAHNTHIGDARATGMNQQGMHNIGQLSRETLGEDNVTLVGFTTYKGRVNAGARWGAIMARMRIPAAKEGSVESILKECGMDAFYTIFDDRIKSLPQLQNPIGHRAIGVVYNPSTERMHNYVPSILPKRYDAIVFIKNSNPLEAVRRF